MKRLSLQWRITLMSVLLIGVTCVAMNLLLCSSGVYYMDTIADSLQDGGPVILNEDGAASFDPQLIAPNEELTIVVDGVQGRFRTTKWYTPEEHSNKFIATQVMPMSRTDISVMRHCRERRFMLPRLPSDSPRRCGCG